MRKKPIGVQEISSGLPRPATAATTGDWGQSPYLCKLGIREFAVDETNDLQEY
jgi:hypothetical protein